MVRECQSRLPLLTAQMLEQAIEATRRHADSLLDSYGEALANGDQAAMAEIAESVREANRYLELLQEAQQATIH